jgi:hypothetical protein
MNDFKDFFKDLRDRITSPLFGSFIISWLVSNWNLVLIILFNNADTLKKDRFSMIYNSFINQSWINLWVLPSVGCLIYLFGYPIVKNKIKIYNATKQAEGDHEIVTKTIGYSIPLSEYNDRLSEIEKERSNLASLIKEQLVIRDERNAAVSKVTDLEQKISNLSTDVVDLTDDLSKAKNLGVNVLDGKWKATLIMREGASVDEPWNIHSNMLYREQDSYVLKDSVANFENNIVATELEFAYMGLHGVGSETPSPSPDEPSNIVLPNVLLFKLSVEAWVSHHPPPPYRMIILNPDKEEQLSAN